MWACYSIYVGIEYYLEMSLWLKETHMALHSLAIARVIKLSRCENCYEQT